MNARTLLTLLASASLAVTGVSLTGCNGDEGGSGPGPRDDQQPPPANTGDDGGGAGGGAGSGDGSY